MKTRKILSALLAAAMTCAMCLSAGAADVSPCIYDLEKESTHKTVSAGSCSYDCYTTLYYGNASKGCLWAVEKNKKDAQAALKTYLYENDNLVEEAGWSTSSSYIHLLDTKKRAELTPYSDADQVAGWAREAERQELLASQIGRASGRERV